MAEFRFIYFSLFRTLGSWDEGPFPPALETFQCCPLELAPLRTANLPALPCPALPLLEPCCPLESLSLPSFACHAVQHAMLNISCIECLFLLQHPLH
jgi:hypothetical protein